MPKTQPLCTDAKLNLRDRVLGEVVENSFIVLPGKVETLCPNPGEFSEEFYNNVSRAGDAVRISVCAGPTLL